MITRYHESKYIYLVSYIEVVDILVVTVLYQMKWPGTLWCIYIVCKRYVLKWFKSVIVFAAPIGLVVYGVKPLI